MKKIFLTLLAVIASVSVAKSQTTGGFEGPSINQNSTTVAEALKLTDEANVTLTGHIVNSLGDEKYTFKDATGEVIVEVDTTKDKLMEMLSDIDIDSLKAADSKDLLNTIKGML